MEMERRRNSRDSEEAAVTVPGGGGRHEGYKRNGGTKLASTLDVGAMLFTDLGP